MTEEEKIKFVNNIFESESKLYENTNKEYDMQDKIWLHRYLTKSNYEGILRADLESAYQIALNLSKK